MGLLSRIERLEKAHGIVPGVDDVPIFAIVVSTPEQVEFIDRYTDEDGVLTVSPPEGYEGNSASFSQFKRWAEAIHGKSIDLAPLSAGSALD